MNKMNRIFNKLQVLAAALVCVLSCNENQVVEVHVSELAVEPSKVSLETGATQKLDVVVNPSYADRSELTWSSADESIATVSEDGTVSAVSAGITNVTAKLDGKLASCQVRVVAPTLQKVEISDRNVELCIGDVHTLSFTVSPDYITDYEVSWKSENYTVASVTEEGIVKARSVGTAVIVLTVGDIVEKCMVKVVPVIAESVTFEQASIEMEVSDIVRLNAIVGPSNTTDKTVYWVSSDPTVANVDQYGRVLGYSPGTATITATCGKGKANCVVTVKELTTVKYEIGDTFVDPDGNEGIVYYITDNGRHGKAITKKKVPYSSAYYSSETLNCGASSQTDGKANTQAVRTMANYPSAYPGFKWLEDNYGSDWYVPAAAELYELFKNYSVVKEASFATGCDPVSQWLISSTEDSQYQYKLVKLYLDSSYSTEPANKSDQYELRAVYAF